MTAWRPRTWRLSSPSGRHPGPSIAFRTGCCSAALRATPPPPPCYADEFRYGRWVNRSVSAKNLHNKEYRCRQFEYVNATCGPPFSLPTFCAAVGCGGALLFVGDSLMRSNYRELKGLASLARDLNSTVPGDVGAGPDCSASGVAETFTTCRRWCEEGSGRDVRVSYARHDFLTNDVPGQARYGRDASSLCEGWHERRTLRIYSVVVLGTGAHLAE